MRTCGVYDGDSMTDVLIVGGGPVGQTALGLAQQGVTVKLLETENGDLHSLGLRWIW